MKTTIFAQLGNAVIKFFAFFVKLNPMWAYRFTHIANRHADKFLLGEEKEIKLIKKLLAKGADASEIRTHEWSAETVLAILKDNKLGYIFAGNFVDYVSAKMQFDAAMASGCLETQKQACKQRKYTPTGEQIQKIVSGEFDKNKESLLDILVKKHNSAFSPRLLDALDNKIQICWLYYAGLLPEVKQEQVAWILQHPSIPNAALFIKHHFMNMPKINECAHNLRAYSQEYYDTWVQAQDAATLCWSCLDSWAQEKNEQYLRLIEEKAYIHNDSDSAIKLVRSTNKFVFQLALKCIVQNNASEAYLLPCVDKDNDIYPTMVEQILSTPSKIKHLTESQVAKLSNKQRSTYWKNMALWGYMSAQQYATLPEEELKNEICQIMEDNALISWFQKNQEINEYSLSKFGNRELSERVQYWLAKNGYLAWLVYYFSGSQIFETTKIAFAWDWKLQKNDTKHHLSTAAFKKLVDDDRARVIRAYLHVYKNILPEKREYLLCSHLKHLAVGIGTR